MKVYKTNEATIKAWLRGERSGRNPRSSIFFEGRNIYSYGYHFPLGIKQGNLFLLNKDRYSPTTTRHQSLVIGLIIARYPSKSPEGIKRMEKGTTKELQHVIREGDYA